MRRVLISIAMFAMLVMGFGSAAMATGDVSLTGDNKHRICHATGSSSNPFVSIEPSKAGVFNGHLGKGHQSGEDIVPPFEYKGVTYSQNWDAAGQAIFNNGCALPKTGTTTVTTTTTTPTTTTVTTPGTTVTTPGQTTTTPGQTVPGPVVVVTKVIVKKVFVSKPCLKGFKKGKDGNCYKTVTKVVSRCVPGEKPVPKKSERPREAPYTP